jgi:hypothetical protein
MDFDPESAKMETAGGFDAASAKPIPQPTYLDRFVGGAKATGQGALDAVTGTLGLPGEITNALQSTFGVQNPRHFQTKQDFDETAKRWGLHYDPQNQPEKFIRAGTEGVGSMAGPGVPAKLAALIGSLSGIGGEIGKNLFQDAESGDNLGKLVGTSVPPAALFAGPAAIKHVVPPAFVPPFLSAAANLKMGSLPGVLRGIARSLLQQNLPNYGQEFSPEQRYRSPPQILPIRFPE